MKNPGQHGFSSPSLLFVLPILALAGGDTTPDRMLYKDSFVQVVTPDNATVALARTAAKKVKDAWQFDLAVMHWSQPMEPSGLLAVRILSDERMDRESGPNYRATARGQTFRIRSSILQNDSLDLTFAHELGHIQMYHATGKHSNAVPNYFLEGHGLMMNWLYCELLDVNPHGCSVDQTRTIASFTAKEAVAILTDPQYNKTGTPKEQGDKTTRMERMGLYFVEYLRGPKAIRDAIPKMGRVFELVGQGRTYEETFSQTYGISVNRVISEIQALFEQTQSHPMDRFKGMRFEEDLAKSRGVAK